MATLIQAKQIEGIVTASSIQGDFLVSGSLVVSGSGIFTNDITASGVVSASQVLGVHYGDIIDTPNFVAGTGISISQSGNNITITNVVGGGGVPQGTVSGSSQLTASYDSRYTLSGSVQNVTLPSNIVSGSSQISYTGLSNIPAGIISSSQQLPQGLVSGSSQVLGGSGVLSGSTQLPSGLISSSTQVIASLPSKTVSGSILPGTNITILSGSGDYIISSTGGANTSISDTAPVSPNEGDLWWKSDDGNLYVYYDGYWIVAVNVASFVSASSVSVPAGTISGSDQLTSSFDSRYALSGSVGGDTSFDGNRIVSNTLLGDLYTQSFNAGTSGSITDFLNSVFFPQTAPTANFTNQTANFNTNLATTNTNLVSVSLTDTVDNSPYTLTLSGAGASSLTAVPMNAASSSWQIRAASNLSAATYTYNVIVGDSTSATRTYSGRTITIAQAGIGTLSTNGTFYIIESATSQSIIRTNSNGYSGGQATISVSYSPNYGTQSATSFTSSNSYIAINQATKVLSLAQNISGSGIVNGSTQTSNITWNDQYGNVGSGSISVFVTKNNAPTATLSSSFTNTNQATGSSRIVTLTISDTESDSLPNSGLVWTNYNSTYFTPSVSSPNMFLNSNNISIPAGTYSFSASLKDVHGFNTTNYSSSVTISQAGKGTLGGDTTMYIIESAVSGNVFRDATGFGGGNPAQLTVSYTGSFGAQSVQSFTSSNPAIVVSNNGNVTLAVNLSGSVTQSGATISSNITFQDQYGNIGSGSVTANVFANNAPIITFVSQSSYNTDNAISGSTAGTLTVTDTEGNSPFNVTLGGTDGAKFLISGSTSPFLIRPTGSLSSGSYSINLSVIDTYGKTTNLNNESIKVDSVPGVGIGKIYIYYSSLGSDVSLTSTYNSVMGASTISGDTPPEVLTLTVSTGSPYYVLSGSVGQSSYSLSGGKSLTLAATISGSDFANAISQSAGAMTWNGVTSVQTIIVFPSGSTMVNTPISMTDSTGGSTFGEYVLVEYADGTSAPIGPTPSNIQLLNIDGSHLGFDKWFVIGAKTQNIANNMRLKVISSSGSVGNF